MERYRVLIVDDDEIVAASLKDSLEILDIYTATVANSGPEGLEKVRERPFDAYLVDQRMPGMTGVEFIKELLLLDQDPLIYVITAEDDNVALEAAEKPLTEGGLPIKRYVPKPWPKSLFSVDLKEDLRDYTLRRQLLSSLENHSTRQKETEKKLAVAQERIVQFEKEEAAMIGALTVVSAASHELNNINAGFTVNAQMLDYLQEDLSGLVDEVHLEGIQNIRESIINLSRRFKEVTKFLNTLTSSVREPKQVQSLDAILELSLHELSLEIDLSKIQIVKQYTPGVSIPCYDKHLSHAFYQIIKNAVEAMQEKGGTLIISTRQKNTHVEVRISDQGMGIPESIVQKVFIPFFSRNKIYGGKGGTIAHKIIVADHQGRVDIDSITAEMVETKRAPEDTPGTTVTITLPIS